MMMGIIIKDLSNKLNSFIDEKGGVVLIDASWTNTWLEEKTAPFIVSIVDKNGDEIKDAKVAIKKK
jgi:hypothetical protein